VRYFVVGVLVFVALVVSIMSNIAEGSTRRAPCRDTVSYATGQALIKNDGWVGDPTDGKEALYGPRGTCVLIAV
jgi:hypothetical protein